MSRRNGTKQTERTEYCEWDNAWKMTKMMMKKKKKKKKKKTKLMMNI